MNNQKDWDHVISRAIIEENNSDNNHNDANHERFWVSENGNRGCQIKQTLN